MDLIVCPSAALAETCRRHRPSHVLTIVSPGEIVPPLADVTERLVLAFNDLAAIRSGLVAPASHDIETIIRFGHDWSGERPCVVQCGLGVSRSPAAAYIVACARYPDTLEREISASLRAASSVATPNPLMVSLADDLLGRDGRMTAAVEAIGRGAEYAPYSSFTLAIPCPAPV